ncbi:heme oxygenase [Trema orientale]|uniref:Heme oxygenase n=1 Tax=Trema orientale TaxID=63057 RepID=A0A2P5D0K3_TREOI|nr:heme oxygenase [Trema orientale]
MEAVAEEVVEVPVGAMAVGVSSRFWRQHEEESTLGLFTPFLVCLGAGDLDSQSFRHCISQSLLFFQAFIRVYDQFIAEEYSFRGEEIKSIIRRFRASLAGDILPRYATVFENWGLELPNDGSIHRATAEYRDFLLKIASGEVLGGNTERRTAYTLAAIVSFLRLYQHLTDIIRAYPLTTSNHIYKQWLDFYSSEEIEKLADGNEYLLDQLSLRYLCPGELELTDGLYHRAMELQLKFFASQPICQPTVVPLARAQDLNKVTIFSDFDMTCSVNDSVAVLGKLVVFKSAFSPYPSYVLSGVLRNLSNEYIKGFKDCINRIRSSSVPGEVFDYDGLKEAIEEVAAFEKWANDLVTNLMILKNLDLDAIKLAGRYYHPLQKGCRQFFEKIVSNENPKIDVHIISYCWSGDLIRSAFSPGLDTVLNIHSNELATEVCIRTGKTVTTGEIVKKVESPFEKLETFKKILEGHERRSSSGSSSSSGGGGQGKHLKVYIGGEVGDILCLVEADIGIVLGASINLVRLGKHFGLSFVPLIQGLVDIQMGLGFWRPLCGTLYTVGCWAEIEAFILGL